MGPRPKFFLEYGHVAYQITCSNMVANILDTDFTTPDSKLALIVMDIEVLHFSLYLLA